MSCIIKFVLVIKLFVQQLNKTSLNLWFASNMNENIKNIIEYEFNRVIITIIIKLCTLIRYLIDSKYYINI